MADMAVLLQFIEPTDQYVELLGHLRLNGGDETGGEPESGAGAGEAAYSLEALLHAMQSRCQHVIDLGTEPGRDTRRTLLCVL